MGVEMVPREEALHPRHRLLRSPGAAQLKLQLAFSLPFSHPSTWCCCPDTARSPYPNFANNLFASSCDSLRPIIAFGTCFSVLPSSS
jgi:hypothetical protein